MCCLLCVVFWLWLKGKRPLCCYIWWKSGNPHFRWFLSLIQSVANGVDDDHCFSAMGWHGLPEFGSLIIVTVSCKEIEISGLHLSLLRDSLQREYTVKLLSEWEVGGYYKYKYSSIFTKVLCFLNVVIVSLSDHRKQTTIFFSLVKNTQTLLSVNLQTVLASSTTYPLSSLLPVASQGIFST